MKSPGFRERQFQVRQDAILEVAQRLLATKGYIETSMDNIANDLGISKATLYQHFSTKEELAVNVIAHLVRQANDEFSKLDPALSALARLEQFLRQAIRFRISGWSIDFSALPIKVQDAPVYKQEFSKLIASYYAIVEQAKAEGDIDSHLPTVIVVQSITRLLSNPYQELLNSGQTTPEELSNALIEIILNGIRGSSKNP